MKPILSLRRQFLALVLVASASAVHGQSSAANDTLMLTLQQAIELAQEQSPSAKSAKHSWLSAQWSYKYFQANYLPSVTLSSSPYLNKSINKITQGDGTAKFIKQN